MKLLKKCLVVLLLIIALFELYLTLSDNLYVNDVLKNTLLSGKIGPDINELELFPHSRIDTSVSQPWPISSRYGKIQLSSDELKEFDTYQTVSYLVIHKDSLLFEQYWGNYTDSSFINSFSMAKSFTALLIGCAIKDGLIHGIDDAVGKYIDEFNTAEKRVITIKHLLTMSSGLDFKEAYVSPFAWPAKAYYGPDVNAITLNAKPLTEPGKYWMYKGGDTQLLGMILKRVTGKSVAAYASEKLWKPMGAEHQAFWSTDEKAMEKVSCCWYTNARDYARFSKLVMQYGKWNNQQLVDSAYVAESVLPAALIDDTGSQNDKYGFQWWLMTHRGHRIFYARGIRGQYIFGVPDLNLIIVRLGHKRASKSGHNVPKDVYLYLDAAMKMAN